MSENPFIGMRAFDYEQRALFFGREQQSYALYRLMAFGFIAVIGSSGSGKSSLVRAGLLPLLLDGDEKPPWQIATMTPGGAPIERLADAVATLGPLEDEDSQTVRRTRIEHLLRRSSSGIADALDEMPNVADDSILIVVDQFEEIFRDTAAEARDEIASFVRLLLQLYRRKPNAHVLITMRSDFIGDCALFPGLSEAVSETQYLVPSLSREQRSSAITKPIARAGASIDSSLVERFLNDAGFENDQLPVMQHALRRMWIAASGRDAEHVTLTDTDYRAIGTLDGAISQHADDITQDLGGREKAVESVFRALSERDADGRAIRRVVTLAQLIAETGLPEADVRAVVDRFRAADSGFLLPARGALTLSSRIDVVHEALLRRWNCMTSSDSVTRGWLDLEEDDGRYYRSLLARIAEGETTLPLDRVAERYAWWTSVPHTDAWARRYGGRHEDVEQFFARSRTAFAEAEAAAARAEAEKIERRAQKERETRRFLIVAGSIAAVAVVLLVVTLISLFNAERTTRDSLISQSNAFARDATAASDRGDAADAVLLALAALPQNLAHPDRPFTWTAYGALTDALANLRELHTYRTGGFYVRARYLPGDKHFFSWTDNGKLQLWTNGRSRPDRIFDAGSRIYDAAISRNRRYVAIASSNQTVSVWDIGSGRRLRTLHQPRDIYEVAFVGTDQLLTSNGTQFADVPSKDTSTTSYDTRNWQRRKTIRGFLSSTDESDSADARYVLTIDPKKAALLWDSSVSKRLRSYTLLDLQFALLAPDGKRTALLEDDGSMTMRENASGRLLFRVPGQGLKVSSSAFSGDGRFIALDTSDALRIFDSSTGRVISNITLHADNELFDLSYDGRVAAIASTHGSIELWSTATGLRLEVFGGFESFIESLEFANNSTRLISSSDDGTVREWDLTHAATLLDASNVRAVTTYNKSADIALSHDGRYFGVADSLAIGIYSATDGRRLKSISNIAPSTSFNSLRFSPDDRQIAIGSDELHGYVSWDWRSNRSEHLLGKSETMYLVDFSPNGKYITSQTSGTIRVRDRKTGRVRFVWKNPNENIIGLYFVGGGERLVSASYQGNICIYDFVSGRKMLKFPVQSHLNDVALSPDGRLIATSSRDETVRLWNLSDGVLLATRHSDGLPFSVSFSSDGKQLLIAGTNSTIVWDIATARTIVALRGYQGDLRHAVFSKDDQNIMTFGSDKTLRFWQLPKSLVCQEAIDAARRVVPHQMSETLSSSEYISPRQQPSLLSSLVPGETCR